MITAHIEEIEAQTEDILSDVFGSSSFVPIPVDVNAIAAWLGLAIKQGLFPDPNIVGFYDKSQKAIYLARNDPPKRQVFTVAHEFGHFVRHPALERETYHRYGELASAVDEPVEQEANWFAASLLMPRRMLGTYRRVTRNTGAIAEIFGVSRLAMLYRLRSLGIASERRVAL